MRNSLAEQMDNYVDMQRDSYMLSQARDNYNSMTKQKQYDPYTGSTLQKETKKRIQKINENPMGTGEIKKQAMVKK